MFFTLYIQKRDCVLMQSLLPSLTGLSISGKNGTPFVVSSDSSSDEEEEEPLKHREVGKKRRKNVVYSDDSSDEEGQSKIFPVSVPEIVPGLVPGTEDESRMITNLERVFKNHCAGLPQEVQWSFHQYTLDDGINKALKNPKYKTCNDDTNIENMKYGIATAPQITGIKTAYLSRDSTYDGLVVTRVATELPFQRSTAHSMFTNKTFISTSISAIPLLLSRFGRPTALCIQIFIPNGTQGKALWIKSFSNNFTKHENEVLIAPDTKFKYIGKHDYTGNFAQMYTPEENEAFEKQSGWRKWADKKPWDSVMKMEGVKVEMYEIVQ